MPWAPWVFWSSVDSACLVAAEVASLVMAVVRFMTNKIAVGSSQAMNRWVPLRQQPAASLTPSRADRTGFTSRRNEYHPLGGISVIDLPDHHGT